MDDNGSEIDPVEIESDDDDDEVESVSEIMEGDFVVVALETERGRLVHVDDFDKDDCECVFLKQEQSVKYGNTTSSLKEDDCGIFSRSEIVKKLPKPKALGESGRRATKFRFPSLAKWDFNDSLY